MAGNGNAGYITFFRARDPEVFYLEGGYNQNVVDALKLAVPYQARRWDGENKRWEIQKEYLAKVKEIAKCCYDTVYYGEGGDYTRI